MDSSKRQWIVAASKNDEQTLKRLMTNNSEIVRTRDPTTGYTALHWAARCHILLIRKLNVFVVRNTAFESQYSFDPRIALITNVIIKHFHFNSKVRKKVKLEKN